MLSPDLPDLSGLTLLIVDDSDDSLEVLGTFLRSCGAHVLEARNGPAALPTSISGRPLTP